MNQEAIQYLPIGQIECDPQVRERFDEQQLIGLARSIQEVGLQQPIRVRRTGERFVVIDGERRLRASRLTKLTLVPVIVEGKDLCDGEVIQRQLIANLQRAGLSACERARAIQRLMEATGWPVTEAAGKCGISGSTATRLLAILGLPEAIQASIDAGKIPESAGYLLKRVDDPEKQAALAAQLAEGRLTRDALIGQVKAERKAPSNPKAGQRATALLPSGYSITVTGNELTLDRMVDCLEIALTKLRKLRSRGVDLAAACRILREEAHAESKRKADSPSQPAGATP
ncbi:MAG TPA: ParB/RepB/Spo0J family partition protein [Pirellulales bacterium]|jgi:ParB family chromosome partitioning protein